MFIWVRVWGVLSVSLQSCMNRKKAKLKIVNAHLILACARLTVSALTQCLDSALPGAGILEKCLQTQLLCFSPAPTQFLHNYPWSAFSTIFSWSLEEANLILIVLQLIPLFVVVGAGCVGAAGYVMRLALKNPDCTWVLETAALLCFKYSLAGISVVKWGTQRTKQSTPLRTPLHSKVWCQLFLRSSSNSGTTLLWWGWGGISCSTFFLFEFDSLMSTYLRKALYGKVSLPINFVTECSHLQAWLKRWSEEYQETNPASNLNRSWTWGLQIAIIK